MAASRFPSSCITWSVEVRCAVWSEAPKKDTSAPAGGMGCGSEVCCMKCWSEMCCMKLADKTTKARPQGKQRRTSLTQQTCLCAVDRQFFFVDQLLISVLLLWLFLIYLFSVSVMGFAAKRSIAYLQQRWTAAAQMPLHSKVQMHGHSDRLFPKDVQWWNTVPMLQNKSSAKWPKLWPSSLYLVQWCFWQSMAAWPDRHNCCRSLGTS